MSFRGLKISIIILRALPVRSLQGDFVSLVWRISGAGQNHDFWFVIWKSSGVGEVGKKRKSWESSLAYLSCRPTPVVIVIVYHRKKKKYRNVGGPRRVKLNWINPTTTTRNGPPPSDNETKILFLYSVKIVTELKVETEDATKSSNSRKYLDDDNMKKWRYKTTL